MVKEVKEINYLNHQNHYQDNFNQNNISDWSNKNTVDYWRHERMYQFLLPFISIFKQSKWLTIGDGRYGTDANYLISNGIKNVLATDISDIYLKIAKDNNFITDYKVENAEKLTFEDNTFDFTLCKESYHHFPRPSIALYEMLRVSKKGVILIEPNDPNIFLRYKLTINGALFNLALAFKNKIKKIFGKEAYYEYGRYETVGNFISYISEREIEKIALALNYDSVLFAELNDFYEKGGERERLDDNGPVFRKIKDKISLLNKLSNKQQINSGLLVAVILKNNLTDADYNFISKSGFKIKKLSKNPYLF
jgi:ubiquinone/menaquinone biosynthesis C-methylase UbiE